MDYQDFLTTKQLVAKRVGLEIEPGAIHPALFPFQADIVRWAVRKGRAAIFADTGLGKTPMQLEWSRLIGGKVIILAPLAVARQTVETARDLLGYEVRYIRDMALVDDTCNLYITNFEMLDHICADMFNAVVLDECFAAGTPIDLLDDYGYTYHKNIEDVQEGDKIFNAYGEDTVSDIHRREVKYAAKVTIEGRSIISSPNHPFFTQRGWVGAQDLVPGDRVAQTTQAVRIVRKDLFPEVSQPETSAVLRDILLSEMANESTGILGKGSQSYCGSKTRSEKVSLVSGRKSFGTSRDRTDPKIESNERSSSTRQSIPRIERDEAQTFRAWGQWDGIDDSTIRDANGTRRRMDSGISFITGQTSSRLSVSLQDGFSQSQAENLYRSGWALTSGSKRTGCQENGETEFSRVDSLEILELGHPELDRLRDADGKLYFYDLGATRHPSYSINGLLVHNSSLLKNFQGKTKQALVDTFEHTPYRLCCTATPAPNDIKEIASHSEFLGVMGRAEMLSIFFRYSQAGGMDRKEAWRLKKHAVTDFYRWMCSWGIAIRRPSDLGYDNNGYILPELTVTPLMVDTGYTPEGMLPGFLVGGISAIEAKKIRRGTIDSRIKTVADMVNADIDQWLLWVGLNEEGDRLELSIPGSVQVSGNESPDQKATKLLDFAHGKTRVLITKASIAGFGMNFQSCHQMVFVGIDYSWESYYQAIRRCWRYRQQRPVQVFIVCSTQEEEVLDAILKKEKDASHMVEQLVSRAREFVEAEMRNMGQSDWTYTEDKAEGKEYTLLLGDCTERLKEIPDNSIGLSVYSPPFSDLFVYSASPRDLGNSATREEFFTHYSYIIRENLRVTMPGRICAVHVQDIRAYANKDNYIGVKDFSGDVIEAYQKEGWVFWHRITINKNPQTQAVRLKDHRLLFITLKKDSTDLSGGQADYLLIFKKPGDNPTPVIPAISEQDWIEWAHPVWNGIRETDVLPVAQAKANEDEKHMCPLQLPVIERAVKLWSNPGEIVLSPFAGVGSEGVVSLRNNRRFFGIELKPEYYRVNLMNLRTTESASQRTDLFSWAEQNQPTSSDEHPDNMFELPDDDNEYL